MYETLEVVTSGVAGKTKKGGQSQRRYERLREMHLNDYYKRVAEHAKKLFLDDNNIVAIVVSGPGPTKEKFVKECYLDYRLQKKIITTIDTSYAGDEGIRHTLQKMSDMELFRQNRTLFEKQLVDRFMEGLRTCKSIYGLKDVIDAMNSKRAEVVIVTDKHDEEIDSEEIEIVSSLTEWGSQFETMGGIGAILKY